MTHAPQATPKSPLYEIEILNEIAVAWERVCREHPEAPLLDRMIAYDDPFVLQVYATCKRIAAENPSASEDDIWTAVGLTHDLGEHGINYFRYILGLLEPTLSRVTKEP